jgi:hypothetical protein
MCGKSRFANAEPEACLHTHLPRLLRSSPFRTYTSFFGRVESLNFRSCCSDTGSSVSIIQSGLEGFVRWFDLHKAAWHILKRQTRRRHNCQSGHSRKNPQHRRDTMFPLVSQALRVRVQCPGRRGGYMPANTGPLLPV